MEKVDSTFSREVIEAFEENDVSKASEFVRENMNSILHSFIIGNDSEVGCKLEAANFVLNFFVDSVIKNNTDITKKERDLFDIGMFYGIVNCLSVLQYEKNMNKCAMRAFKEATQNLSNETQEEIKNFLILLYNSVSLSPKELEGKVKLSKSVFEELEKNRIIHFLTFTPDEVFLYSIADNGIRVVRQLQK